MSAEPEPKVRPSGDVEWGVPESDTAIATHAEPEDATSKPRYLSASDIRLVLELAANKTNQVDIAKAIGCSQGTISRTLKAFGTDAAAIGQQLRALTDESITDWRRAKRVAAKRGDHRPAKELIEMAYPELRPQQTNHGNNAGVTVIVAVPGGDRNPRPTLTVSAQAIESRPLSPRPATLVGESTQNQA